MKTLPVTKLPFERGCECGVNLIFGPRLRVSKNARRARARRPVCRRGRVEARKSARRTPRAATRERASRVRSGPFRFYSVLRVILSTRARLKNCNLYIETCYCYCSKRFKSALLKAVRNEYLLVLRPADYVDGHALDVCRCTSTCRRRRRALVSLKRGSVVRRPQRGPE